MKALVWDKLESIRLMHDLPQPEPSGNEVVVRVMAAGVCTTDLHMVRGKLPFAQPPWILGHEIAGIVHGVGDGAMPWKPGDRVVVDPVVGCGCCRFCLSGKKHLCGDGGEIGTTVGNGGYGQFVVAGASNLYRLPSCMSFEEGAMIEPLNCTAGAIERVSNMAGAHAIVFGAGPAGLLFVQLARAYGALTVTLVGTSESSLALGRKLGADRTVMLKDVDALNEHRYDVAIEASGSVRGVKDCIRFVARGGTVVLYGLHGTNAAVIDSDDIVVKDLTVVTSIAAPRLWSKCIDFVEHDIIRVSDIISHRLPMLQAEAFLNDLVSGRESVMKLILLYSPDD